MSRNLSEEHKKQILRRTPLARLGLPEDIVGPVLYLLSDQASFVTGQTLIVDGGSTV
jgi:3-oxoacyl-[acyl-carrier protein] reductase